jgi:hypothetical protein
MAFDLLFRINTDADWSRQPKDAEPAPAPPTIAFPLVESKTLKLLEPSTAAFARALLNWTREQGIPAKLTATAIYTPEQSAAYKEGGKSSVSEGYDWHNVGRAFHLAIFKNDNKTYDKKAYARVGQKARELGGEWLGDKPFKATNKNTGKTYQVYDLAHFEYHPMFDLKTYRSTELAKMEFQKAQQRAKRYA